MFDPAVLGTLIIGLNAERAERAETEAARDLRRPERSSRRQPSGIRVVLARGLRQAAVLLDGPIVTEATHS